MQQFDELLQNATANVPDEYFQLPIDGLEDPIYRERVYCYELYHQLRTKWPSGSPYTLAGEVDKSGHPLIRGNGLDNRKPDFLVHTPGNMEGNFAVIEVKPVMAIEQAIKKDIATLSSFLSHANYSKAIYLLYGNASDGKAVGLAMGILTSDGDSMIEVWHHAAPNEAARRL